MSITNLVGNRGGIATGEPDLWCTYAALRTLSWLGRLDQVEQPQRTAAYLAARRNRDGGYAWNRGMESDAWATFYCVEGIAELTGLGTLAGDNLLTGLGETAQYLERARRDGAFGMSPGQYPDVWATHFAVRTIMEVCHAEIADVPGLVRWLGHLQGADGGLTWSPEHALDERLSDVRACFYGIMAWRALGDRAGAPPWDVGRLVSWLAGQQSGEGGFLLSADADTPCLWATFRATAALQALGARPDSPQQCADWILERRGDSGAFVRWVGYPIEDVWASFCAVGSLRALDHEIPNADAVVARLAELACAEAGYTYREPEKAADALSTAAVVLSGADDGLIEEHKSWLKGCQLPNEGGVMYMPARGSEVRCTAWAFAAGVPLDEHDLQRVAEWLATLQNPDGGFGYWEGRGSDVISTTAAVDVARALGTPLNHVINIDRLLGFLDGCGVGTGSDARYGVVPGAPTGLRFTAKVLRTCANAAYSRHDTAEAALAEHQVRGGGWANQGRRVPDLLTTYESVLLSDALGLSLDEDGLGRFCRRVSGDKGTAWSPLAPPDSGPLADCLGHHLTRRVADPRHTLPVLALS